jgi:hypothetical protein
MFLKKLFLISSVGDPDPYVLGLPSGIFTSVPDPHPNQDS